jgi:DNA mismatch endonuclease Vsr
MNAPDIPGCPDFVFDKERVAVFVDGCFWHGCPTCQRAPSSNQEYWTRKIDQNRIRDRRALRDLRRRNWKAIRIWEHTLRLFPRSVIEKIAAALKTG